MESSVFISANLHRLKALPLYSRKPETEAFKEAPLRVLVTRLSKFRDVERSTAHRFLEREVLAAVPGAFVDFSFFPEAPDLKLLLKSGVPPLHGIRSWHAASDFDLILVSCSFVLELPNLPWLLARSGLGVWASERGPEGPSILYGGSNAMASGALFREGGAAMYDMVPDAMHFGEGEGMAGAAARAFLESGSKAEALDRVAELEGFLVAGRVAGRVAAEGLARKRVVRDLGSIDGGSSAGHPLNGEEAGTVRLEISRGCPAFCSFCFESWDRKPYRELPLSLLLERARALKAATGASTIELSSFNFNSHPDILPLILALNRLFRQVNFMSQRLDYLGERSGLLEAELAAGKRSFTLGVEGVSEAVRRRFNKAIPEASLRAVLASLHVPQVREIKLFYVLSGDEGEGDIAELFAFMDWLKGFRDGLRSAPRILVSVNLLTRMPSTPEAKGPLRLIEAEWQPLIEGARRAVQAAGFEFRMAADFDEFAVGQALALAPFAPVALDALIARGAYYDEGLRGASWPDLEAALRTAGLLSPEALSGDLSGSGLPVAMGIGDGFLERAANASRSGAELGRCHGADCLGCGACAGEDERAMARGLASGAQSSRNSPRAFAQEISSLLREKDRARPLIFGVEVPEGLSGAHPALLGAELLKGLCRALPEALDAVLEVKEIVFSSYEAAFGPWWGLSYAAAYCLEPEALRDVLSRNTEALAARGFCLLDGPEAEGLARSIEAGSLPSLRYSGECTMPKALFSEPAKALSAWLAENHLPATMRRAGSGAVFDLSPKALKKKTLFSASIKDAGEAWLFRFEADGRYSPKPFLERAGESGAWRLASTRIGAIRPL
jgi:hypothetical protein